jgi:hypothetical protein
MTTRKKTSRDLQPEDQATTLYNGGGTKATVTITERDDSGAQGRCQSGILVRVRPPLRNGSLMTWYDIEWFQPIKDT